MKYVTHNDTHIETNHSCFQDAIMASYRDLVTAFGKPRPGDGEKTDVEWEIKFEDGTIATIYNWKNRNDLISKDIIKWNIGGFKERAAELVHDVLKFDKNLEVF